MLLTALLLTATSTLPAQPAATVGQPPVQPTPQGGGLTIVPDSNAPREYYSLWADKPAASFVEAYPIGTGRLGAMVFGGVQNERIVLNESSLWSGSPQDADRPDAAAKLPAIKQLLLEGKNVEAEKLVNETFVCAGPGSGGGKAKDLAFGCYQVLGDLEFTFMDKEGQPIGGEVKEYRRWLDLHYGFTATRYVYKDSKRRTVTLTRNLFGSHLDGVLVYRIATDGLGNTNFDLKITRQENARCESVGKDELLLTGALPDGKGDAKDKDGNVVRKGMSFNARLKCQPLSGTVESADGVLKVRKANDVLIVIGMGTSYQGPVQGPWMGRDHVALTQQAIYKAIQKGHGELYKQHVEKHFGPAYQRVELEFEGPDRTKLTTQARLEALAAGTDDPSFFAYYFLYGRYLMLQSAGPSSLPANLQGLWADEVQTPWNGDYHLNVNLQMNYWMANPTGFGDSVGSLGRFLNSLVAPGERTAKAYYGAQRGWVAHTISNPWGYTSPGEEASWGSSPTGGAWLANTVYQQYAFSQDFATVAAYYPAMKGAAEFFLDTLVEDPKTKFLVTPVSNSPENAFKLADGRTAHTCMGPTIDQAILRDLFTNVAEAARVQSVDLELATRLDAAKARLAPIRVGKNGGIMEWLEDYEEVDPQHRHVSQLYALYPSDQINPYGTPELARAARTTLERRGDGGTGWSLAWKAALWARLGDGDRALTLLQNALKPTSKTGMEMQNGGTYPNLFSAHPPFQIDGNFGATAAIAEMLVQSYREKPGEEYTVHLLPALPKAWPSGHVHGLQARGGLTVSVHWKDGAIEEAHIYRQGKAPGNVRVRYDRPLTAKASDGSDPGSAYVDGVLLFYLDSQRRIDLKAAP